MNNNQLIENLQLEIIKLQKEVERLNTQLKKKKFGLSWINVPESFEAESENKIPILEEVPDLAIHNDDGKPTHILIEGDNYHALTCLNYTHHGKIDVIYIDPPYNTGSDGFTYKDSRFLTEYPDGTTIPKNHPLRHSAWLSFMEKRLRLAKDLLRDNGAILISINEDEFANLKLLCDSLFDNQNYLTTFTLKIRHDDRILKGDKPIHETTEFLLLYSKSDKFKINKRIKDNSNPSDYIYEIEENTDNPEIIELGGKEVKVFRPGQYSIVEKEADFTHLKKINIRGSIKTGNSSGRFHMDYLEDKNNEFNVLYKVSGIGDDGRGYRYFLSRESASRSNGFYFQGAPQNRNDILEIPFPNFFDLEVEFNNVGTEGGVPFDGGKKPIAFIQKFLNIVKGNSDNMVVLDFFAGSGSTAHAIIADNLKGNKSNQVILVQQPEPTCEIKNGRKVAKENCRNIFRAGFENIAQITYDRFKKIISGYISQNTNSEILYKETISLTKLRTASDFLNKANEIKRHNLQNYDDLKITFKSGELMVKGFRDENIQVTGLGGSLKYYRTSFVGKNQPKDATDEDKLTLAKKANCLISITENTLYETESTDYYQLYTDEREKWTAIYFQEDYSKFDEFRDKVIELKGKVNVYIFSWTNGSEFKSEFEFEDNISVKSIPQPILDIYKSLNI